MLIPRIANSLLEKILIKEFNNKQEIEEYWLKKINKRIKKAQETDYWSKNLPKQEIKSLEEFKKLIPQTTRDLLKNNGHQMTTLKINKFKKKIQKLKQKKNYKEYLKDILLEKITNIQDLEEFIPLKPNLNIGVGKKINKLDDKPLETLNQIIKKTGLSSITKMSTSGSTSDPVNIYFTGFDMACITKIFAETYKKIGLSPYESIIMLFPKTSQIWGADGKMQKILPKAEFIDFNQISKKEITRILKAKAIQSYTGIPDQLFINWEEFINEYKEKGGKINLEYIITGGDFLIKEAVETSKKIIPELKTWANPLISNDSPGISYVCKKNNLHINSWAYYPEFIKDEKSGLDELVVTPLIYKGTIIFRYHTGDGVRLKKCDCGNPDPCFEINGRIAEEELHKHFTVKIAKRIIQQTKAYKNKEITSANGGIIWYKNKSPKVFEVYILPGIKEQTNKQEIINELNKGSNELLAPYTAQKIKPWIINYQLVNELPEYLISQEGKWKKVILND